MANKGKSASGVDGLECEVSSDEAKLQLLACSLSPLLIST